MLTASSRGWIGIDLGVQAVKLAQITRAGDDLRLNHASFELDPELLTTPLGRPGIAGRALGQRVRALLEDSDFEGRQIAFALPMPWVDLRSLKIPAVGDHERRAIIENELATVFQDDEPREFDFWETRDAGDSAQFQIDNIMVLSARCDTVQGVIDCARAAGLQCEVLDGLPQSLGRAVDLVERGGVTQPVGAIDWGYTGATLCVVRGGEPLFTRYLRDCGFGPLVNAVAAGLGLTQGEAQEVLSRIGLPSAHGGADESADVQEIAAELAISTLQSLLEQLNKTLAYLRVQRPHLLPARFWLLGGGAMIRNADAFLAHRLQTPVKCWRLQPSDDGGAEAMYGVAAALSALRWES